MRWSRINSRLTGPRPRRLDATASLQTPATPPAPPVKIALPLASAVEGWVKAKATEIKGEERGRALYHFEFWLDAPEEVKRRLIAVAYEFNTPAVMPQALSVEREEDGLPRQRRRAHLRRQGHGHAEIQ